MTEGGQEAEGQQSGADWTPNAQLLTWSTWASFLISLRLGSFICKMLMIVSTSYRVVKTNEILQVKHLAQEQLHMLDL